MTSGFCCGAILYTGYSNPLGQALMYRVANVMGTDQLPVLAVQIHLFAYKCSVDSVVVYVWVQYIAAM